MGMEECGKEEETVRFLVQRVTRASVTIDGNETGRIGLGFFVLIGVADVGGELLLISQFTLCADASRGNRPSYVHAGRPEMSEPMYQYICDQCREQGYTVQTGIFGAEMKCDLLNDGPFTIWLDSREICPKLHNAG